MDLKGQTALVTGASSGIGVHFAKQLAARGVNLVITARRKELLEKLAGELSSKHGVEVTCLPLDLSDPEAAIKLLDQTEGAGKPVDILINNAAFGVFGSFSNAPWDRVNDMISVNIRALTELTHRFAVAMHARDRGHILNVSSGAGYVPVPFYAVYAAAKTYVRNFTEALAHELRRTKVRVCCLCPGAVDTEFWDVAGQGQQGMSPLLRVTMTTPDKVARVGLRALFGWRRNVIAGVVNKLVFWLARFSPRRFLVRIAGALMGKGGK